MRSQVALPLRLYQIHLSPNAKVIGAIVSMPTPSTSPSQTKNVMLVITKTKAEIIRPAVAIAPISTHVELPPSPRQIYHSTIDTAFVDQAINGRKYSTNSSPGGAIETRQLSDEQGKQVATNGQPAGQTGDEQPTCVCIEALPNAPVRKRQRDNKTNQGHYGNCLHSAAADEACFPCFLLDLLPQFVLLFQPLLSRPTARKRYPGGLGVHAVIPGFEEHGQIKR